MALEGNYVLAQGQQDVFVEPVKEPEFSKVINWSQGRARCITSLCSLGCTGLFISVTFLGVTLQKHMDSDVFWTVSHVFFVITALCFVAPAIMCCASCYRYEKQMRWYRRYQAGTHNEEALPTIVHPLSVPESLQGSTAVPVPDTSFGGQVDIRPTAPEFSMGQYRGQMNDQPPPYSEVV